MLGELPLVRERTIDSSSFDRLTRVYASSRSRRSLGGALFASVAGLLGVLPKEAAAHNPLRRCRGIKNKQKRARCNKAARKHNARHQARQPPPDPCAGVACPAVPNGTACRDGTCVITACASGFDNCTGNVGNGRETDTMSDVQHRGQCGRALSVGSWGSKGPCPAPDQGRDY